MSEREKPASITSKLWKDSRHIKGSEYRQEVKSVKAFASYHQNPKQSFRSRKHNGACKVFDKHEIARMEKERNLRADGKYIISNGLNIAWICS